MPVLVTSNFDDDSIKNEWASIEMPFSHYVYRKFLDAFKLFFFALLLVVLHKYALLLVVLHKYVCKPYWAYVTKNSTKSFYVHVFVYANVFLKTLLVLDTLFQETLATGYVWTNVPPSVSYAHRIPHTCCVTPAFCWNLP